jgi:Holliday junction resolvasome RuvABC endonuclease subunit
MLLALDLATTTGWAIGDPKAGNLIASGSYELKQGVWDGGGVRCLRLRHFIEDLVNIYDFDAVYYEKVDFIKTTDAAQMYGALMGAMASTLEAHEIPYIGVPVATWKRTFTGLGSASKQQVMAVARKLKPKLQIVKKGGEEQSDEADAIGVLFHAFKDFKQKAPVA